MARPITLFTGQWADLPFEEVCRLASEWGYDGLEVACWGDHLDVVRAAEDAGYVAEPQATCWRSTASGVGDLQPPGRAGWSATTRSTSGTAASCRPGSGATATPRACGSGRRRR